MGKLYIVATPIGNLGDITYRAVETLKDVDLILAEDTRYSKTLLDHYSVETQVLSYRDQTHRKSINKVLEWLSAGYDIALISDSGTPLISDPGYKLVRDLISHGYEIVSLPGPSAVIAGLSISGLPTDKFTFLGFLPKGPGKREKILGEEMERDATLVIYESPHRLRKLLAAISEVDSSREVSISKDLTKKFERNMTGNVTDVMNDLPDNIKGEYVVFVGKG